MKLANGFSTSQVASCISPKRLELTILPTEKCNFRCTYCYEDFLIGRMPEDVQKGIERLLEHRASDLTQLSINWFGGEPLLAKGVILRIAEHAYALSVKNGFLLTGGMTTNAYKLDVPTLRSLVGFNQDFFQISLDGWKKGHDQTRRRADGKGTFEIIWANLLNARDTDLKFEVQLRIHVTNDNFDSLNKLCFEIGKEFGGDPRFVLNFQDVRDMGGVNGKSVEGVSASQFKRAIPQLRSMYQAGAMRASGGVSSSEEARKAVEETLRLAELSSARNRGESASGRRAYLLDEDEPYICYASKPNFFLIRADGRVGKCTVALDDERNTIGRITEMGLLELNDGKMRPWFGGFEELDPDYLGCPIQFIPKAIKSQLPQRIIPADVVAE